MDERFRVWQEEKGKQSGPWIRPKTAPSSSVGGIARAVSSVSSGSGIGRRTSSKGLGGTSSDAADGGELLADAGGGGGAGDPDRMPGAGDDNFDSEGRPISAAARTSKILSSSSQDSEIQKIRDQLDALEAEMAHCGGATGHWLADDHEIFLRMTVKHRGRLEGDEFLGKVGRLLSFALFRPAVWLVDVKSVRTEKPHPLILSCNSQVARLIHCSPDDVKEHVQWYTGWTRMTALKKSLLQRWRSRRAEVLKVSFRLAICSVAVAAGTTDPPPVA